MRATDGGSASIWLLSGCALVLAVAAAGSVRAGAVLARHRAEAAADVAALAAAEQIGHAGSPCAAAVQLAQRNGAVLTACTVHLAESGRSGTVTVRVRLRIRLPVVGARAVDAVARAGRDPPGAQRRSGGST